MQEKFKKLLHEYKVNAFKVAHDPKTAEQLTKECLTVRDEALNNAYHYHFHKLEEANRAEIINMINNYTMEALLPPIVEKIMMRQVILEKKQEMTIHLLEQILEVLSGDGSASSNGSTKSARRRRT